MNFITFCHFFYWGEKKALTIVWFYKIFNIFLQKKGGFNCNLSHLLNNSLEKDQKVDENYRICFRCGDSGHSMFSCNNDYSPDDLKVLYIYILILETISGLGLPKKTTKKEVQSSLMRIICVCFLLFVWIANKMLHLQRIWASLLCWKCRWGGSETSELLQVWGVGPLGTGNKRKLALSCQLHCTKNWFLSTICFVS